MSCQGTGHSPLYTLRRHGVAARELAGRSFKYRAIAAGIDGHASSKATTAMKSEEVDPQAVVLVEPAETDREIAFFIPGIALLTIDGFVWLPRV